MMLPFDHHVPATATLLGHRVSVRLDQSGVNVAEWSSRWTALLAPWLATDSNHAAALLAANGAEALDIPENHTVLVIHPWVGDRPYTVSQQHPPDTDIPGLPDYANTLPTLLSAVERLAFECAVARSAYPLIVHAGAVSRDGVALVFPADSDAGKTTLTLSLSRAGWLPLGDDICPFTEADGEFVAVGCPRCGHLSVRSELFLRGAGIELEGPVGGLSRYFRPTRWGTPAPVRAIIAPRYHEGAPLTIEALTQAQGAAALYGATFRRERVSRHEEWAAAVRLAQATPAFALTYGSLDSALAGVETITHAVLRLPDASAPVVARKENDDGGIAYGR